MLIPESASHYYNQGGLSMVGARSLEKLIFDSSVTFSPLQVAYWKIAPLYYHYQSTQIDQYPRDVDPFRITWIDPKYITKFTRRKYPAWPNTKYHIGTVLDGDWDIREKPPIDRDYSGTPPELYLANQFEETVLYRSLQNRFCEDTPWEETEFVREAKRIVAEGGKVWNGCQSEAEIERTCTELDHLYKSMKTHGCLSHRQILRREGRETIDFLHSLLNEIVVDIGRNGEILFVDGRHRLAIAKLLGLERVPIAVLIRHKEWMMSDDPGIAKKIPGHPDLPSEATGQ